MRKQIPALVTGFVMMAALGGCSMMAGMMGMGDLMGSMNNMDKVMKNMPPKERMAYMNKVQAATLKEGAALFQDASLGSNGNACTSCHPGGRTTGGEAQVPMRDFKIPIPTLQGAAATFPKYKVPNDRVITLVEMDNNCIGMFMGGKALPLDSPQAIALSMYVSSLSNGEDVRISQR